MNLTETNLEAKVRDAEEGNSEGFAVQGTGTCMGLDFVAKYCDGFWQLETISYGQTINKLQAPNGQHLILGIIQSYKECRRIAEENDNVGIH